MAASVRVRSSIHCCANDGYSAAMSSTRPGVAFLRIAARSMAPPWRFSNLGQVPGDGCVHRHRPGDGRRGAVGRRQHVRQCSYPNQAVVPALVLLNSVDRGRHPGEDGGVRRPGDGGDLADHALRPSAFAHQAAQVRDLQSKAVAIAQVALVEAIHRNQNHAMRLGIQPRAPGEERHGAEYSPGNQRQALQKGTLPPGLDLPRSGGGRDGIKIGRRHRGAYRSRAARGGAAIEAAARRDGDREGGCDGKIRGYHPAIQDNVLRPRLLP